MQERCLRGSFLLQPRAQPAVGNWLDNCEAEKALATLQFRNYLWMYEPPVQSARGLGRVLPPSFHPKFSGGSLPNTSLASGDAQPLPSGRTFERVRFWVQLSGILTRNVIVWGLEAPERRALTGLQTPSISKELSFSLLISVMLWLDRSCENKRKWQAPSFQKSQEIGYFAYYLIPFVTTTFVPPVTCRETYLVKITLNYNWTCLLFLPCTKPVFKKKKRRGKGSKVKTTT